MPHWHENKPLKQKITNRSTKAVALMRRIQRPGHFFMVHLPKGESWVSIAIKPGKLMADFPKEVTGNLGDWNVSAGDIAWDGNSLVMSVRSAVGPAKSKGSGVKDSEVRKSLKALKESKLKMLKQATIGQIKDETTEDEIPQVFESTGSLSEEHTASQIDLSEEVLQTLSEVADNLTEEDINDLLVEVGHLSMQVAFLELALGIEPEGDEDSSDEDEDSGEDEFVELTLEQRRIQREIYEEEQERRRLLEVQRQREEERRREEDDLDVVLPEVPEEIEPFVDPGPVDFSPTEDVSPEAPVLEDEDNVVEQYEEEKRDPNLEPGVWNMRNYQKGEPLQPRPERRRLRPWDRNFNPRVFYGPDTVAKPHDKKTARSLITEIDTFTSDFARDAKVLHTDHAGIGSETGSYSSMNRRLDDFRNTSSYGFKVLLDSLARYKKAINTEIDAIEDRITNGRGKRNDLQKFDRLADEDTALGTLIKMLTSYMNMCLEALQAMRLG